MIFRFSWLDNFDGYSGVRVIYMTTLDGYVAIIEPFGLSHVPGRRFVEGT